MKATLAGCLPIADLCPERRTIASTFPATELAASQPAGCEGEVANI